MYMFAALGECIPYSIQNYENCSCLEGNNVDGLTARAGMCDATTCRLMALFCFLFFVAMFIIFMAGIFHVCVLLR